MRRGTNKNEEPHAQTQEVESPGRHDRAGVGAGADGGVDLVLRKGGEKYLVQCKQWRAYKVTVQVVRELYGVMAASGAAGGFVVTSGRFTADAQEFAAGRNVELMDGKALFELIRSVRGMARDVPGRSAEGKARIEQEIVSNASAAPVCPRCAGQMVRWWRVR